MDVKRGMFRILIPCCLAIMLLAGCGEAKGNNSSSQIAQGEANGNSSSSQVSQGGTSENNGSAQGETSVKNSYRQISQEEAREIMAEGRCIIVDVRTREEYDSGYIPGAICIPNETIGTEQPEELPDLDQKILIYCRSGRRSKEAAQKLADIGYANIYEFGGIIDWSGEIVNENSTVQD